MTVEGNSSDFYHNSNDVADDGQGQSVGQWDGPTEWGNNYGYVFGVGAEVVRYEKQKHNRQVGLARRAHAIRMKVAQQMLRIARERRNRYDEKFYPLEQKFYQDATEGIKPDYEDLRGTAIEDTEQSYDRQEGIQEREARRYGIDQERDPDREKKNEMDETATKVFAGNTATDEARARAEEQNQTRRAQAYSLARGIPTNVGAAIGYGGNLGANATEQRFNREYQQGQDTQGYGNAANAIAGSYEDGGEVTTPEESSSGFSELFGNQESTPNPDNFTQQLPNGLERPVTDEDTSGFKQLIGENTDKNFVNRIANPGIHPNIGNPDGSHSTHSMMDSERNGKGIVYPQVVQRPDGSMERLDKGNDAYNYAINNNEYLEFDDPREANHFAKNYKSTWRDDGRDYEHGGVVRGAVQMESGSVVIPADVVKTLGPDYFQDMIEKGGK